MFLSWCNKINISEAEISARVFVDGRRVLGGSPEVSYSIIDSTA